MAKIEGVQMKPNISLKAVHILFVMKRLTVEITEKLVSLHPYIAPMFGVLLLCYH